MKDYYRILEVPGEATAEEITRAYKTLVQRHHPDNYHVSDKTLANAKMQSINEAYETLSDEARRRRYDRQYARYQAEQPALDKRMARQQGLRKFVYGFLLAVFVGLLIRGGLDAFNLNPMVKWVMGGLLVLLLVGLLTAKNDHHAG